MKVRGKFPVTTVAKKPKGTMIRDLVAENTLSSSDLILPIFITYGVNKSEPITSMPGVNRYSLDLLEPIINRRSTIGFPQLLYFQKLSQKVRQLMRKKLIIQTISFVRLYVK